MKGRTRRPFNVRCAKGATSRKNETNVDLSCGWNRRSSSPRLPIAHTAADEFAALHGNGHRQLTAGLQTRTSAHYRRWNEKAARGQLQRASFLALASATVRA